MLRLHNFVRTWVEYKQVKELSNLLHIKIYVVWRAYDCCLLSNHRQRNWVFAKNPNFIIPISQQPDDDAYLSYFKLTLFDPPEFIVWNIYGLRHLVLKKLGFKNPSLWQRLNSFQLHVYCFLCDCLYDDRVKHEYRW